MTMKCMAEKCMVEKCTAEECMAVKCMAAIRKGELIFMLKSAVDKERLGQIRELYEASFPKAEKKPFGMILEKQKEGLFEILAIEDAEGHFCGLAIMVITAGLALLDYFAIAPQYQGIGLGSAALQELCEWYGRERIVVEIERTTGRQAMAAGNAGDRIRRKAFYFKNGMTPVGFLVELFGVEMEVLTYGRELTYGEYYMIYANMLPKHMVGQVKLVGNQMCD